MAWCSAAVGTLAGVGYPLFALIGTGAILVTNVSLHPVSRWIDSRAKGLAAVDTGYRVRVVCEVQQEGVLRTILMRHVNSHASMILQGVSTQPADEAGKRAIIADIHSSVRNDLALQDVISRINIEPGVTAASWERLR